MNYIVKIYDNIYRTGNDVSWAPYDGNLYKLFTERRSFSSAQAKCKAEGSHLAKILDSEQELFLKNYILKLVIRLLFVIVS